MMVGQTHRFDQLSRDASERPSETPEWAIASDNMLDHRTETPNVHALYDACQLSEVQ
jgi:hypothetical protein